ncbi:MAG: hypothetical protein HUK26_01055 [Duodenibacillus sp.]|nr:hypothetical protein [Duodenibacillus sp.]
MLRELIDQIVRIKTAVDKKGLKALDYEWTSYNGGEVIHHQPVSARPLRLWPRAAAKAEPAAGPAPGPAAPRAPMQAPRRPAPVTWTEPARPRPRPPMPEGPAPEVRPAPAAQPAAGLKPLGLPPVQERYLEEAQAKMRKLQLKDAKARLEGHFPQVKAFRRKAEMVDFLTRIPQALELL